MCIMITAAGNHCGDGEDRGGVYSSVQNSATFPVLLLKSSKKVVFLNKISSK